MFNISKVRCLSSLGSGEDLKLLETGVTGLTGIIDVFEVLSVSFAQALKTLVELRMDDRIMYAICNFSRSAE